MKTYFAEAVFLDELVDDDKFAPAQSQGVPMQACKDLMK